MPVGLDPHMAGTQDPPTLALILLFICVVYGAWFIYTALKGVKA